MLCRTHGWTGRHYEPTVTLRTTGSRKSWAGGDASARGLFLALTAQRDEMGYPSALSASGWGFQDVSFSRKRVTLSRPLQTYVMENILFKISFPAEFHAQTAVECAMVLHPEVKDRLDDIERVVLETQESGNRIINKIGPLDNPADRDHCLQYMVAVPLIFGRLTAEDYEDDIASDPSNWRTPGQDGMCGERTVHLGISGIRQASYRQFGAGLLYGWNFNRSYRGRLSGWSSSSPPRRNSVTGGEVRSLSPRGDSSRRCDANPRAV